MFENSIPIFLPPNEEQKWTSFEEYRAFSVHDKFELQPVMHFFLQRYEVQYIANYTENESWHANKQKLFLP